MLSHLSESIKAVGIELYVTRAKFMVTDVFKRSGFYSKIGEDHFFAKRITAIEHIQKEYGDAIDVAPFLLNMPVEKDDEASESGAT